MGFYPIPPEVCELIAKHLKPCQKFPDRVHVLDPCCGEGKAIRQLAGLLGVDEGRVYAVELHQGRIESARKIMPKANIQGPAGYLGVAITPNTFGLAYLNPPFDDEIGGGGREEESFVRQAAEQVAPDGVLCLVMPWRQLKDNDTLCRAVDMNFDRVRVYRFPAEHRKYDEIVLFGVKRKAKIDRDLVARMGCLTAKYRVCDYYDCPKDDAWPVVGEAWSNPFKYEKDEASWRRATLVRDAAETDLAVYELPWTHAPRRFLKFKMTEEELSDAINASPLNKALKSTPELPVDRPPLPPGKGHVSQLLASGMLDGVVEEEDGKLHVVRGTSRKVKYLNAESSTVTENEKGDITYKEVWSERIDLVVRCVDQTGKIWTFTSTPPVPDPEAEPPKEEVKVTVVETKPYAEADRALTRKSIADQAENTLYKYRAKYREAEAIAKAHPDDNYPSYAVVCCPRGGDEGLDAIELPERYASINDAEREAIRLEGLVLDTLAGNKPYYYFVRETDDEPNVKPADVFKRALALPSPC